MYVLEGRARKLEKVSYLCSHTTEPIIVGMRELGSLRRSAEKSRVFLHISVRSILRIGIIQVMDNHNTHKSMRGQFYNIPTVEKI